jgi:hypothetical protein
MQIPEWNHQVYMVRQLSVLSSGSIRVNLQGCRDFVAMVPVCVKITSTLFRSNTPIDMISGGWIHCMSGVESRNIVLRLERDWCLTTWAYAQVHMYKCLLSRARRGRIHHNVVSDITESYVTDVRFYHISRTNLSTYIFLVSSSLFFYSLSLTISITLNEEYSSEAPQYVLARMRGLRDK